jgi:hypothetical protein
MRVRRGECAYLCHAHEDNVVSLSWNMSAKRPAAAAASERRVARRAAAEVATSAAGSSSRAPDFLDGLRDAARAAGQFHDDDGAGAAASAPMAPAQVAEAVGRASRPPLTHQERTRPRRLRPYTQTRPYLKAQLLWRSAAEDALNESRREGQRLAVGEYESLARGLEAEESAHNEDVALQHVKNLLWERPLGAGEPSELIAQYVGRPSPLGADQAETPMPFHRRYNVRLGNAHDHRAVQQHRDAVSDAFWDNIYDYDAQSSVRRRLQAARSGDERRMQKELRRSNIVSRVPRVRPSLNAQTASATVVQWPMERR